LLFSFPSSHSWLLSVIGYRPWSCSHFFLLFWKANCYRPWINSWLSSLQTLHASYRPCRHFGFSFLRIIQEIISIIQEIMIYFVGLEPNVVWYSIPAFVPSARVLVILSIASVLMMYHKVFAYYRFLIVKEGVVIIFVAYTILLLLEASSCQ
jgi:hypothetical protein